LKTKIAYIIPTLSLGGAEKQQINILNGINCEDYEVKLFVLKNRTQLLPQLKNSDIELEIFNIESVVNLVELYRFVKSLRSFRPDIIHSHMYNANMLSRFLKLSLPKSRVVNHYHGMSSWISKPKLWLDRATSSLADQFLVVSQKSYDLRLQRERYDSKKMTLLFNSVDIEPATNTPQQKRQTLTIGVASRLIPLKNIEGAIFMISELLKRGYDVELVVAGNGTWLQTLQMYAQKLGVQDRVQFLGFVAQMESFYERIDLYCISSFTEDLPLSIIEAMMCAKPIIASNVGGIPAIVKDLSGAILIDNFFDIDEIERIVEFLDDLKRDEYADELVEYASANFNNDIYCSKLSSIYDRLLKHS